MNMRRKYVLFLAILVCTTMLIGCFGTSTKSYTLNLKVVNKGVPLVNVGVDISHGSSVQAGITDTTGQVSFKNLTGKIELLIETEGFEKYTHELTLTQNTNFTIELNLVESAILVGQEDDLTEAIANENIETIFLAADIADGKMVEIFRPLTLNLNGKTLKRDISYITCLLGSFELDGLGKVDGNIGVYAPQATCLNYVEVTGVINIGDIAPETWNEYYGGNRLVVSMPNVAINLYKGAQSIEFTLDAGGNELFLEGSLGRLITNSAITVTGADLIEVAEVNAKGVVFDYPPKELVGTEEPEILNPGEPDPSEPDPDEPDPEEPEIPEDVPFEPGAGGNIPHFGRIPLESGVFPNLYIESSSRRNNRATIKFLFINSEFAEFVIEDEGDAKSEAVFERLGDNGWEEIPEKEFNSFLSWVYPMRSYEYRLRYVAGPYEGYVSNEVNGVMCTANRYFENPYIAKWGPGGGEWVIDGETHLQVKEGFKVIEFDPNGEEEQEVTDDYIYEWFLVHPTTFEIFETGITDAVFSLAAEHAGYFVMLSFTEKEWRNKGYACDVSERPVRLHNIAHVGDISKDGFTLYLSKSVDSLEIDDFLLEDFGSDLEREDRPVTITSIEPLGTSGAIYRVHASLRSSSYYLQSNCLNWLLCQGTNEDGYEHWIANYSFEF